MIIIEWWSNINLCEWVILLSILIDIWLQSHVFSLLYNIVYAHHLIVFVFMLCLLKQYLFVLFFFLIIVWRRVNLIWHINIIIIFSFFDFRLCVSLICTALNVYYLIKCGGLMQVVHCFTYLLSCFTFLFLIFFFEFFCKSRYVTGSMLHSWKHLFI